MIEQRPITWQITELTQSIARRKRLAAKSEDPRYAAIVRKSIELDEERLLGLWAQLHAAAESDDTRVVARSWSPAPDESDRERR